MPTPPGATPTPTPAAAHGTFVFVDGVEVNNQPTDTYRLNQDGTLTLATGSPFPVSGLLASSGSFLIVANGNSVTSYRVDANTGQPTAAGNAQVVASRELAADAHNIYVAGTSADGANYVIYSFSIGGAGLLTPLPGSPFQLNSICDVCDTPTRMAINNGFVLVGTNSFHDAGEVLALPRAANGALGTPQPGGTSSAPGPVSLQPNGNSAFAIDPAIGAIDSWTLDAAGHPTAGPGVPPSGVLGFGNLVVDRTGKYLLAQDSTGVVHIFTIGANATLSQIGTSEPVAEGVWITFDPSGHFVIVGGENPDQLSVFTFDPASAAIKKVPATYPIGKLSVNFAIVSE
jgi:6-phosphogluconolactonase (cycloisomerase 2 family)